ncbi:MAG: efflux RND transporter periplasmic adaptor subunit [Deltaproteobacteria bacterium]|nr:efflux RND transporter periplasmic adaptor subunit [Deltaproteobacteria bacterium]
MSRLAPICTLATAVALLLAAGCRGDAPADAASADAPPAPMPVRCEPLAERTIAAEVALRGTVQAPPNRHATVSSPVAGRLTAVRVAVGDTVAEGDVVAVVDSPQLRAEREEAVAAAAAARAAVTSAQKDLARKRALFDEGIVARRAVEELDAQLATARADLATARAREHLADEQLARAEVRAPLAGTVVRAALAAGELVDGTPGTPIVEIADLTSLELTGDLASADVVRVTEGAVAEVRLDPLPNVAVPGRVARVDPTVDPATSLGRVRVALSPPPDLAQRLAIGLAGQATLHVGDRRVVAAPPGALRRSLDGKDEVVVCAPAESGAGTVAKAAEVTVGERGDGWVEVADGPAAGTPVVVDRAVGLEDDAPLAPGGAPAATAPAPEPAP